MTAPTDPAEELRAAAFALREASDETSATPWKVVEHHSRKNKDLTVRADLVTGDRTKGVSLKYRYCLRGARWNALTNPALAEPLAVWLESAAQDSEAIGTDFRALAVARAINGAQS